MNSQAQLSAAQQLASSGGGGPQTLEDLAGGDEDDDDIPDLEAPEDDGPVDETGVDPKDIDLVMAQVNCTRAKAVRVLKESGGDLINASVLLSFYTVLRFLTFLLQSWRRASNTFCSILLHSRFDNNLTRIVLSLSMFIYIGFRNVQFPHQKSEPRAGEYFSPTTLSCHCTEPGILNYATL